MKTTSEENFQNKIFPPLEFDRRNLFSCAGVMTVWTHNSIRSGWIWDPDVVDTVGLFIQRHKTIEYKEKQKRNNSDKRRSLLKKHMPSGILQQEHEQLGGQI